MEAIGEIGSRVNLRTTGLLDSAGRGRGFGCDNVVRDLVGTSRARSAVMRSGTILVAIAAMLATLLVGSTTASAMPQFARKYKLPCSGCHDALAFPRLNDVGYKFRRAGFRMPENIGKDELSDFAMADYFSARAQVDNTTGVDRINNATTSSNTFEGELNFYALTGSFQKYFASETELTFAPGGGPDIENAYGRVVYGGEDLWLTGRAGVFHAFEGLGASDRSLGSSRPLIFDLTPNQNQDTLMRMVELNRVGVDVGVQVQNTSLSVEIVNRAHPEIADGSISPNATTADSGGGKDLIVVANQILGTRSSVSAYWAHGQVALPIDADMFVSGARTDTWTDKYDKVAAFAAGDLGPVLFLGGAQLGFDHALDSATGATTRFRSIGAFAEANLAFRPWAIGYVRADYFDPSTSVANNHVFAGTVGTVFYENWVSITPELQVRRMTDETTAAFIVHAGVIY